MMTASAAGRSHDAPGHTQMRFVKIGISDWPAYGELLSRPNPEGWRLASD
jgi:hypothetical protein